MITKVSVGPEIDDDELEAELGNLEQENLDKTMLSAPIVPATQVGNGGELTKPVIDFVGFIIMLTPQQRKAKPMHKPRKKRKTKMQSSRGCRERCSCLRQTTCVDFLLIRSRTGVVWQASSYQFIAFCSLR